MKLIKELNQLNEAKLDLTFGFEDEGNAKKTASALKKAGIHFGRSSAGGISYFDFDTASDVRKAIKLANTVINHDKESEWDTPGYG